MTLEEVREAIDRRVAYYAHPAADPEEGVITGCSPRYAFVLYDADRSDPKWPSKATAPEALVLL